MLPVAEALAAHPGGVRRRSPPSRSRSPTRWAACWRPTLPPGGRSRRQRRLAMDGYAVRAADTEAVGSWLALTGEPRAGRRATAGVTRRARPCASSPALRCRTGADAIADPGERRAPTTARCASRVPAGRRELRPPCRARFPGGLGRPRAGTLLDPRGIGLAAAMGHAVAARPSPAARGRAGDRRRAGRRRASTPAPGQIVQLQRARAAAAWPAAGRRAGRPRHRAGRSAGSCAAALDAAAGCDLLLTTGGASVGEHDLVQEALGARGAQPGLLEDRDAAGQAA